MRKALVPVDGSPNSDRAVSHVVMLAEINPALEVVLLNVQPEIDDWQVRRFLKKEEVEAMEESRGGDALQSARALLDAAKVNFVPQVLIGPVAETIARIALEQNCDGIVMGTRGLGAVAGAVLGSVASQVVHLSDVPVTRVKEAEDSAPTPAGGSFWSGSISSSASPPSASPARGCRATATSSPRRPASAAHGSA